MTASAANSAEGAMRAWMKFIVPIAALALVLIIAHEVAPRWFTMPNAHFNNCDGRLPNDFVDSQAFYDCLVKEAKLFYDKDYTESKDLAKTFLTLLSAILVASITFSEKIVDVGNAKFVSFGSMIFCWVMLLVAIVSCGTGLAIMSTAAGLAAYSPDIDYKSYEINGVTCFFIAAASFIAALLALIFAGVTSLLDKRAAIKSKEEFS